MQIISPFDEHNRTLVENVHPPEDREAAEVVQKSMLRDGVRLCGGAKQLKVARTEEGKRLWVDGGDAPYELVVDEILVGAGRAPKGLVSKPSTSNATRSA
jgi:pyruvate/2-oxoglutarate dehydrogenase complex dihydrolipoamide dehydrogenase (E3) component